MNRDLLKKAIKKLVLQEITIQANNVGTTDTLPDEEAVKALKKALPGDDTVEKRPGSSKVTASGKHQVAMEDSGAGHYNVVSITNGSDRRTAKNLKLEEVSEFIKKHAKESETSYVDGARAKSINGGKEEKKEEKKEEIARGNKVSETDEMEESEEDTQQEIADDATVKADVKVEKDLAPVDDEVAPQLGGELVDKIEKIIDRVLKSKNKAEPKSAYLKTDTTKESPDKLSVKLKDTPAIKGSDKPIGKPSPKKKVNEVLAPGPIPAFHVYIPANVYDGKHYDYQTIRVLIPINQVVKSEQDAINWVNDHKEAVLDNIDKRKTGGGKRMVRMPVEKNVFFNDKYHVEKTSAYQN